MDLPEEAKGAPSIYLHPLKLSHYGPLEQLQLKLLLTPVH